MPSDCKSANGICTLPFCKFRAATLYFTIFEYRAGSALWKMLKYKILGRAWKMLKYKMLGRAWEMLKYKTLVGRTLASSHMSYAAQHVPAKKDMYAATYRSPNAKMRAQSSVPSDPTTPLYHKFMSAMEHPQIHSNSNMCHTAHRKNTNSIHKTSRGEKRMLFQPPLADSLLHK